MRLLPYRIEQTTNRTSRATMSDGSILIRLAKNLSSREEARHIDILLKRMTKAFLREQQRMAIDPFRVLLEGSTNATVHLVTGQSVRFEIQPGTRSRKKQTQNGWKIVKSAQEDKRTFHRMLWHLLAKSASVPVSSLVRGINEETIQADIESITLKLMRSRWGSCGRRGQIALSTPLLLTSPEILRYVIIHELSHMPHPNHSKKFWETVEEFEPDYRQRVRELRRYKLQS